jgi:hypothetical protein
MQKPTLLVLAAGMGSRFGGLKQIEPVGPSGETIIDYSVYDAIRAGFGKLVFVIRRDIEAAFKESVGRRFEDRVAVEYAFQELDAIPAPYRVPAHRRKPWGTGHAVLVARDLVREPFAVINGDDFYGGQSLRALAEYLSQKSESPTSGIEKYAMVGFELRQTLSEFGHVSRGICQVGSDGFLNDIVETTQIEKNGRGARHKDDAGKTHDLSGDEIVSMNLWGFTPSIFERLSEGFTDFLKDHGGEEKSEFYLPSAVNALVASGRARVRVLQTPDSWFGVTYREDKPFVDRSVRALIEAGVYPPRLW